MPLTAMTDVEVADLLATYEIDSVRGFLPPTDPLRRLTAEKYQVFEDLASSLPNILGIRLSKIREVISRLPQLSLVDLTTSAELYRAHFLLALFAHSYVWGGFTPVDYLPANIAVPLWDVSCRLDIPPVLCYLDIVLNNWKRIDAAGVIDMGNIVTLNNLYGGRDESWFYLLTVEIEDIGAKVINPLYKLNMDISSLPQDQKDLSTLFVSFLQHATKVLRETADVIRTMVTSLSAMREGCDPYIFYHRVRPFLSGWRSNPAVPQGVRYLGVTQRWEDRNRDTKCTEVTSSTAEETFILPTTEAFHDTYPYQQFAGGSAAQSSLLPFLDIAIGVDHSTHEASPASNRYLTYMREYMPKRHREFLGHFETVASLRPFILKIKEQIVVDNDSSPLLSELLAAYNSCVTHLSEFRRVHIGIVMQYVAVQQKLAAEKAGVSSLHSSAGGKGTGGTHLMDFLGPIRDGVVQATVDTTTSAENNRNAASV